MDDNRLNDDALQAGPVVVKAAEKTSSAPSRAHSW
jgi:hypothetical protein